MLIVGRANTSYLRWRLPLAAFIRRNSCIIPIVLTFLLSAVQPADLTDVASAARADLNQIGGVGMDSADTAAAATVPWYTFVVGVTGGGHDGIAKLVEALAEQGAVKAGRELVLVTDGQTYFTTRSGIDGRQLRMAERNTSVIMNRIIQDFGAAKDIIFVENRFPARGAIWTGHHWADRVDLFTLAQLPVITRFLFLQRNLYTAWNFEHSKKDPVWPSLTRLDQNAMLLETLYNGIACKTASGESRCNVIKINDLDRACDRSVGGADASDHLIERELLRAWIEVRRTLSWGLGFELESITPDLRLTVCSTLERLILESEPETSGAFTNRNTNEAVVEDFFSARACLYPTIAGCPRSSLSAPGRSVKMAPQAKRFVLVVGIEGERVFRITRLSKSVHSLSYR
jgi:hypothetical protein